MRQPFRPWQVWWVDFDPSQGREQQKVRPAVILSSSHHLRLMAGALITVSPLTTTDRGWIQHVAVATPRQTSWVMTEQIRTVSETRFQDLRPTYTLSSSEIAAVQKSLNTMLA
jgi:mRNA interferase MazF